jgi:hypothetical protein
MSGGGKATRDGAAEMRDVSMGSRVPPPPGNPAAKWAIRRCLGGFAGLRNLFSELVAVRPRQVFFARLCHVRRWRDC